VSGLRLLTASGGPAQEKQENNKRGKTV